MRPLNRPMFRYGGPIKEGVMSGIREPKRNGGSMSKQFGTGLVGDERYPKTDGREHHLAVLPFLGLNALRQGAIRLGSRYLMPMFRKQIGTKTVEKAGPSFIKKGIRSQSSKGYPGGKVTEKIIGPGTAQVPTYGPTWLGRDPLVKSLGWAGKTLTSPTATGWAQKGFQMATAPSSIIAGIAYYMWPDGKERRTPPPGSEATGGPPGGGDKGMYYDDPEKMKQALDAEKISKQKEWNDRIQKYRDIMDIKGMNKQAAYKSLVDASKIIQESGDFKGDIRSGKLINEVIQAASKQFDKPKATSDAINTLILQNELKKDLNKEENALANLLKSKQIQVADKTLQGQSTAEIIQAIALRTGMPQSDQLNQLVSINNPELNLKTIPTEKMGKKDPMTYIAEVVSEVNNDPKTPNYPPGNYVIKDKIIQIDETGTITPIPINALK